MSWNYNKEQLEAKLKNELKVPKIHFQKLESDMAYLSQLTYFDTINYVILFGSCSKGTATLKSDIDLCVITDRELTRYELADIRVTLNDDTGFDVETNTVILTEKIYRENYHQQRLYREIGQGLQLYHKG